MKIQFKDEEITLKRTLRSLIMFENITSKPFSITSTTDVLTYFYAIVLCSGDNIDMGFDEFIDLLDEQPTLMDDFQKWLIASDEQTKALSKKKSKKETVKETH
jgi:hypothetical protein